MELRNLDGYTFGESQDCILYGATLELTPYGSYVYSFNLPLYDDFESIHLAFSERTFVRGSDGALDQRISGNKFDLTPHIKAAFLRSTTAAFLAHFGAMSACLDKRVIRCIAVAMYRHHMIPESLHLLGRIRESDRFVDSQFVSGANTLEDHISHSRFSEADALVERWIDRGRSMLLP